MSDSLISVAEVVLAEGRLGGDLEGFGGVG